MKSLLKQLPHDFRGFEESLSLKEPERAVISELAFKIAGINLGPGKATMIESRLNRRLKYLNLNSFTQYIDYLKKDRHESTYFINALTTNKTEFFREQDHFNFLKATVFSKANPGKFMIWSAASSSGEEVYTLAMLAYEHMIQSGKLQISVLGTDINTEVIKEAIAGVYKEDYIKPIPYDLLCKYFLRGTGKNLGYYKASKELREIVKFRVFNLLADEFDQGIAFDVIFLRNVLIYFDSPTIQIVIDKMARYLKPKGYLFIGHSETLNSIKHNFKCVGSAIYQKQ